MSPQFAYAKPTQFYYHTFDPKNLQYTNIPISGSPPEPPPFAKRDIEEEKPGETPEKSAQDDQPPTSEEKQEADTG